VIGRFNPLPLVIGKAVERQPGELAPRIGQHVEAAAILRPGTRIEVFFFSLIGQVGRRTGLRIEKQHVLLGIAADFHARQVASIR
jgi:hypothetical protein